MVKRIWRGIQHLKYITGGALIPDQRQRIAALLWILRHSRSILRESGLPGLMRYLDAQAADHKFIAPSSIPQADALAALIVMRPFRHCMKRAILRYVILKSWGEPVSFRIGVERPDRGVLQGHAWVALNDIAFGEYDDQHQRMTTIFCYPPE